MTNKFIGATIAVIGLLGIALGLYLFLFTSLYPRHVATAIILGILLVATGMLMMFRPAVKQS